MPKPERVPKTTKSQVQALDEHLYLLRDHLHRLVEEGPVHLKAISAELRVLICKSSGTEGLLWRLMDELQVSDALDLHVAGNVDRDHPLAHGLAFAIVPF